MKVNQKKLSLSELQDKVLELEEKLQEMGDGEEETEKDKKDNVDKDNTFDTFWRQIFYWNTFFESVTGYTQTGTVTCDGSKVLLTTGAVNGNSASLTKTPTQNQNLKFSVKIYFRCNFTLGSAALNTTYIVFGNTARQYFGFKILAGSIYAVSSNNGTGNEKAVLVGTASATNTIECRYYPSNKITYYLNPSVNAPQGVATISTKLPIPNENIITDLMQVSITTNTNAAKTIQLSNFEILQAKNYTN